LILGDGTRKRSTLFAALQSHYVFEDRYGRPGNRPRIELTKAMQ
jgi:hypothetical protein